MSMHGTSQYAALGESVPVLVQRAVDAALAIEFPFCVHPATGRLLQVLAAGLPAGAVVGETGTGTGVGLAWMVSGAPASVRFLSVEVNEARASAARSVFVDSPNVTIVTGDVGDLLTSGPFDLLVLDGGWGSGKNPGPMLDPDAVLREGGVMTVDDFAPMDVAWPPSFEDRPDEARIHWLTHPSLLSIEIRVAEDMAVVVARRTTRETAHR